MRLPSTWREALDFFAAREPSTIRLGLERMERALAALGNPERRLRAVHVAGTNGKGSTCAFLDAVLRAEGYRVGLYTSPHLVRPNERIRVGGEEIEDAAFGQAILEVLAGAREAALELTYFELGTLVAFWHFARAQVDVAVVETGLGGRLDATRLCHPAVTAITSLSLDHTELLGPDLAHVAREKAGIFKPHVPAVSAPQAPEALSVLKAAAAAVGCPLYVGGAEFDTSAEGEAISFRGLGVERTGLSLGLKGRHQVENAGVALAALELLGKAGLPASPRAIGEGLAAARWPGRLETLSSAPLTVADGAHNPGGARALAVALRDAYPGRRVRLVFGVLREKELLPMLESLLPAVSEVYLAPPASPRALAVDALRDQVARAAPALAARGAIRQFTGVLEALEAARREAAPGDLVLCAGSLVLVGQARSALGPGQHLLGAPH